MGNVITAGIFTGVMWVVQVFLFKEPDPTLFQYSIMFWVILVYEKIDDPS